MGKTRKKNSKRRETPSKTRVMGDDGRSRRLRQTALGGSAEASAARRRRGLEPRMALCVFLLPLQELVWPGGCAQWDSSAAAAPKIEVQRFRECAFGAPAWSAALLRAPQPPISLCGRSATAIARPSAPAPGTRPGRLWRGPLDGTGPHQSIGGVRRRLGAQRSALAGVLGMGMADFSVEVRARLRGHARVVYGARSPAAAVCTL